MVQNPLSRSIIFRQLLQAVFHLVQIHNYIMKTMKTILSAAFMIAMAFVATGCSNSDEPVSSSSPGGNLDGYLQVSSALFQDDLARAKDAAAKVASDDESPLAKHAVAVAEAETIELARKGFTTLSKEAIRLSADESGYHVISCPMVKDGLWVQKDTSIKNPYMGQKMPNCGSVER